MKILVLSDSHGNISNMLRAVEAESPRMIFHLGDCWRDAERLLDLVPDIPLCQVPGNCDYRSAEPTEQLLCLEDKRILLCHGHTYSVKQSLLPAAYAAEEKAWKEEVKRRTAFAGKYDTPFYRVVWKKRMEIF